jgi:hypothetical protein
MSAKTAFATEKSTMVTLGIASVFMSLVLVAIPLLGSSAF